MNCIISCLLTNINNNNCIEKYIENGSKLLDLNIDKIIYIEENIYNKYYKYEEKYINNNTILWIFITKYDLLYIDKYDNNLINTNNIKKDTKDYICLMCNKTEFMKKTIIKYKNKYENYIWIDFGIYYIMNDNKIFNTIINFKKYDKIRIGCIQKNNNIKEEDKNICWRFAGGIFGGNYEKLLIFADLMYEKCIYYINKYDSLIWEVNLWALIEKDNPELFDVYYCDHNKTIIENY